MTRSKSQDDKNIKYLETRYMYERRGVLYVANEEINQIWDETDIPDFIAAWENGWTMPEIAEFLGSDEMELSLLAMDLIKQKKIEGSFQITRAEKKLPRSIKIKISGKPIRIIKGKEPWICINDIWDIIDQPESLEFLESLQPKERSNYIIDTAAGRQSFIFINMSGWSKLYNQTENKKRPILNKVKEGVNNRMESGRKTKSRPASKEKKGTG